MNKTKLLIVLLLIAAALFIYQSYLSANPVPSPLIKKEFQKIQKTYSSDISASNNLSLWWISQDNLNIINDNSSGEVLKVFNCINDSERKIFKEVTQTLGPKINQIMKQQGFSQNKINSSASIEDDKFYDYVQAYEKGADKCVFTASPDCGSLLDEKQMYYAFSFTCTKNYDLNYQSQAFYRKDLGIKDSIIHVQKQVDDFVYLNVNYRRSGHFTIAKKVDNKWTEIVSGQDKPPCNVLEQNKVPKEIQSECY